MGNAKKYIVIIFLLLFTVSNLPAIDRWTKLISPTTHHLYKSSFTDTLNGWVCGDGGVILHTSNGGLNWETQDSQSDYQIVFITFLNKNTGWAVGNKYVYLSPVIYSTTNGGQNWNLNFYPDTTLMFNTIYFRDLLNGFIGGYGGLILKTTNGGINWSKTVSDSSLFSLLSIKGFKFINAVTGYAYGGRLDLSGVIRTTTNSGNFWQSASVSPEPLNEMIIFDSLNSVAVGGDYEFGASIIRTINGGANWKYEPIPFFGIGNTICKRIASEWWIGLGYALTLAYTLNSGVSWDYIQLPDSSGIYNINFPDSTHGWAFGIFGTILKYNGFVSGVFNENNTVYNFKLFQNYPNPFNSSTVIKFEIPNSENGIPMNRDAKNANGKMENGAVVLKIYDVLGKEVETLVNEKKSPGTYEFIFDGSNLASGLYFYKLHAGNFGETRKMLLIK